MKQELKSGIKEFDEAVEQFENGEINFVELTCRLWNKAYSIGCSEQLQQADVSGLLLFKDKLLGGVIKPTTNNMSNFISRLSDEKSQLDEKIAKLEAFSKSDAFNGIDNVQRGLLKIQLNAMATYSQILDERLWMPSPF